MSNLVKQTIKNTIATIQFALKQIPTDKQAMLTSRLSKTLKLYSDNQEDTEKLKNLQRQLQFDLNFIKLSHPSLNYDYKPGKPKQSEQQKEKPMIMSDEMFEIEKPKQFSLDNLKKRSQVREEVEFSNWFEGNADPEALRKHKDLLERQHFGGEYWKERQMPVSPTRAYLKEILTQKPEDILKTKGQIKEQNTTVDESDDLWGKVKR